MFCANTDDEIEELYLNKSLGDLSDKDIHLLRIYYNEEVLIRVVLRMLAGFILLCLWRRGG